jgi:hypothetical protein
VFQVLCLCSRLCSPRLSDPRLQALCPVPLCSPGFSRSALCLVLCAPGSGFQALCSVPFCSVPLQGFVLRVPGPVPQAPVLVSQGFQFQSQLQVLCSRPCAPVSGSGLQFLFQALGLCVPGCVSLCSGSVSRALCLPGSSSCNSQTTHFTHPTHHRHKTCNMQHATCNITNHAH